MLSLFSLIKLAEADEDRPNIGRLRIRGISSPQLDPGGQISPPQLSPLDRSRPSPSMMPTSSDVPTPQIVNPDRPNISRPNKVINLGSNPNDEKQARKYGTRRMSFNMNDPGRWIDDELKAPLDQGREGRRFASDTPKNIGDGMASPTNDTHAQLSGMTTAQELFNFIDSRPALYPDGKVINGFQLAVLFGTDKGFLDARSTAQEKQQFFMKLAPSFGVLAGDKLPVATKMTQGSRSINKLTHPPFEQAGHTNGGYPLFRRINAPKSNTAIGDELFDRSKLGDKADEIINKHFDPDEHEKVDGRQYGRWASGAKQGGNATMVGRPPAPAPGEGPAERGHTINPGDSPGTMKSVQDLKNEIDQYNIYWQKAVREFDNNGKYDPEMEDYYKKMIKAFNAIGGRFDQLDDQEQAEIKQQFGRIKMQHKKIRDSQAKNAGL